MTLPDWNDIETVFLDMDGTLLDLHFDNHFWLSYVPERFAELNSMPLKEAHADLGKRYKAIRGQLDWYCVDYWTRELGLDIASLKLEMAHKIAVHPHVIDFLSAVRERNKRVILVTNAHRASLDIKMKKTRLTVYFDEMISAHDIGIVKEETRFWEALQECEPFVATKTLLIDDNIDVLKSADTYGIGYLYAVKKPDTQGGEINNANYHALDDFRQIMPDLS